jgi:hypothetical protein
VTAPHPSAQDARKRIVRPGLAAGLERAGINPRLCRS